MNIIKRGAINSFIERHPESQESLNRWYLSTSRSEWKNISEIKESFSGVDYVGNDLYVFDIKGNKFRLIVRIFFKMQLVYIRFIGTHAEYDRVDLAAL